MKEKIKHLYELQAILLNQYDLNFKRNIYDEIKWQHRVTGLIGERGVGKTTIMLQRLKETGNGLYFSADSGVVKEIGLFNFVDYLYFEPKLRIVFIDEIHKYENWREELKNIYDSFPDMQVVFSGSSSLDLYKGILDLARRVEFYNIFPMNYAEYLKFYHQIDVPQFSFEEIINNHEEISFKYGQHHTKTNFEDFLNRGQYPYLKSYQDNSYILKFTTIINKIILEDLPTFLNLETSSLDKLSKLLYFIANSTPSEISFSYLANKIKVHTVLVENVMTLLSKIGIISLVPKFSNTSQRVRKEYKIFLGNTNLYNAYNLSTDIGILREAFFVSQVKRIPYIEIFTPTAGDFIVELYDRVWKFEIGGKNKDISKYPNNVMIIKDDIKVSPNKRVIPLWVFGLMK